LEIFHVLPEGKSENEESLAVAHAPGRRSCRLGEGS
jgi:hypothetical protein